MFTMIMAAALHKSQTDVIWSLSHISCKERKLLRDDVFNQLFISLQLLTLGTQT